MLWKAQNFINILFEQKFESLSNLNNKIFLSIIYLPKLLNT